MSPAPPLRIEVRPARAWIAACRAVAVSTVGVVAAGVGAHALALGAEASLDDLRDGRVLAPAAVMTVALVVSLGLAAALWRRGTGIRGHLGSHRGGWTWTDAATPTAGSVAVEVTTAVDLGGFLLLKLRPLSPSAGLTWLPLARRDLLPGDWHGLRCALARTAMACSPPDDLPDRSDRLPG